MSPETKRNGAGQGICLVAIATEISITHLSEARVDRRAGELPKAKPFSLACGI
jgi:hypothetical protein